MGIGGLEVNGRSYSVVRYQEAKVQPKGIIGSLISKAYFREGM